jgi:ribosomal protein L37E
MSDNKYCDKYEYEDDWLNCRGCGKMSVWVNWVRKLCSDCNYLIPQHIPKEQFRKYYEKTR